MCNEIQQLACHSSCNSSFDGRHISHFQLLKVYLGSPPQLCGAVILVVAYLKTVNCCCIQMETYSQTTMPPPKHSVYFSLRKVTICIIIVTFQKFYAHFFFESLMCDCGHVAKTRTQLYPTNTQNNIQKPPNRIPILLQRWTQLRR